MSGEQQHVHGRSAESSHCGADRQHHQDAVLVDIACAEDHQQQVTADENHRKAGHDQPGYRERYRPQRQLQLGMAAGEEQRGDRRRRIVCYAAGDHGEYIGEPRGDEITAGRDRAQEYPEQDDVEILARCIEESGGPHRQRAPDPSRHVGCRGDAANLREQTAPNGHILYEDHQAHADDTQREQVGYGDLEVAEHQRQRTNDHHKAPGFAQTLAKQITYDGSCQVGAETCHCLHDQKQTGGGDEARRVGPAGHVAADGDASGPEQRRRSAHGRAERDRSSRKIVAVLVGVFIP